MSHRLNPDHREQPRACHLCATPFNEPVFTSDTGYHQYCSQRCKDSKRMSTLAAQAQSYGPSNLQANALVKDSLTQHSTWGHSIPWARAAFHLGRSRLSSKDVVGCEK